MASRHRYLRRFPQDLQALRGRFPQGRTATLARLHRFASPGDPVLRFDPGNALYPTFGFFKGQLDEFRVYDRGLDESEVLEIVAGDAPNDGFLEFLGIERPIVETRNPIDVMPTRAILRAEVDSIGGLVTRTETVIDRSFKPDTIAGMVAWFSAQDMNADLVEDNGQVLGNGQTVTEWKDASGNGRDMTGTRGDPSYYVSSFEGKPVVNFDGDDLIWGPNYDFLTTTGYTMVTIARYTGGTNLRVIASRQQEFPLWVPWRPDRKVVCPRVDFYGGSLRHRLPHAPRDHRGKWRESASLLLEGRGLPCFRIDRVP